MYPVNESGYLDLLHRVRWEGEPRKDRTGVGTRSLFGERLQFNLRDGFPVVTTKRLHFKSVLIELLWFLRGDQDTAFLKEHGVTIWDKNARSDGKVGPIYGAQWRHWPVPAREDEKIWHGSYNQLSVIINQIKRDPTSRRHLISAWNVTDLDRMALPPCHFAFQFYVRRGEFLDCQVHMRSADLFLGVPFNIASYALLMSMVAQVTDLLPGKLIITLGDAHIYLNHFDQVEEQLRRVPLAPPTLILNREVRDIDAFTPEHVSLQGYESYPAIKAPMAV